MEQWLVKPSHAIIALFIAGAFWVGLGHVAKISGQGRSVLTLFASTVEVLM